MYIDLDSGTILNGPIVRLPEGVEPPEDVTDAETIDFGRAFGTIV